MDRLSDSGSSSGLSSAGLTDLLAVPPSTGDGRLPPGARLGDVTILRFIAEGGMGQVYEGLQGMPCRTVAVKLVRAGVLAPAAMKRFEYEAHLLGRLSHPGIARIYSMGVQPVHGRDLPYFVMEYIEDARSLTAYAQERGLSIRDRLELFREACRAVAHGHQRGVIHRDLKPGNILVDAAGQPRIIDFGVARSVDADAALTTMHTTFGQLLGTLQYMSPEQFEGATHALDMRADVYSLGVVLYELLTGRVPYELARQPVYEAARIVREVVPAPLGSVNPRLRGDLATIVATCLDKDPARRYSSAAELEADLGRQLAGEPIVASPPRLLDAVRRLARRHTLAAIAAAGILAALVAGSVGISIFAVQAARERATAVREQLRADSEARTARQQLYVANLRSLQASLAGRNLRMARQLFADNRAIVGEPLPLEMHVLGASLDEALVVLPVGRGPVNQLAYSHDGTQLAASVVKPQRMLPLAPQSMVKPGEPLLFAVGAGHTYDRLPASAADRLEAGRFLGDLPSAPAAPPADAPPTLAVSADGRRRAVHAPDGSCHVLDGTAPPVVIEGQRGRLRTAAFSPDGTRLAIQGSTVGVGLWDSATGRLITRCGDPDERVESFLFSPDGSRLAVTQTRISTRRCKSVHIHACDDGRRLCTVPKPVGPWASNPLLAFSSDGRRLVTALDETDLCVWDATTGAEVVRLQGHAAAITALAPGPAGRPIAGGAANGTLRLWDPHSGRVVRDLMGHDGAITSLAFGPDGETLASGGADGAVRIWSSAPAGPLAVLPGLGGLAATSFSADGRLLAVATGTDAAVTLWDPRTVTRLHTLTGPRGRAVDVAFSPDGTLVAAAAETDDALDDVRVWATDTGALVAALDDHPRGPRRLAFSPDGSRLLTTAGDGAARVWDPRTGRLLMASTALAGLTRESGAVFGLGGTRVAHRDPHILDAATGAPVAPLKSQRNLTCLTASRDGGLLAVGLASGVVRVVDFATGHRRANLVGHVGAVHTLAFDASGSRLVTGGADGNAALWDVPGGTRLQLFPGHDGPVDHVLLTPDGRRVVTVARDGATRIWDTASGNELCVLAGQRQASRAVALSPDGTQLVTAGVDGAIRIWGPSDAQIIRARQDVSPPR